MAYLRHYRAHSNRLFQAGDPFSLKPPKFIRKLQPGKLIKKALPIAASFVPGLGAAAALLPQPAAPSVAVGGLPEPYLTLLRFFGYPGGDPFGGMTSQGRAVPKVNVGGGFDLSGFLAGAGRVAAGALGGAFKSSPIGGALGGAIGAILPGGAALPTKTGGFGMAAPGFGRRRSRRMNPGNTRALRRAISRVKSFTKLARSTVAITKSVRMRKGKRR